LFRLKALHNSTRMTINNNDDNNKANEAAHATSVQSLITMIENYANERKGGGDTTESMVIIYSSCNMCGKH